MKINSIIDLVKDLDTSRQTKNLNKLLIRILLHLQVEFSYCSNKTLDNKWQTYTFFLAEESLLPSSPVCTLQEYLYEPNSSILKAGAFKSIAQSFGIDKLAVSSHLYTSRKYVSDFPGRAFEILEAYPFSKQVLKKCSRKYPQANVSTRNFPLTPDEIRRLGGIKDGGDIYLFATMVNSEKTMIYCRKK